MTIEEKAKAYDDALGWMRKKIYPTLTGTDKKDAEHYFPELDSPELTKSEDEKIRKDIVAAVEMYEDFTQSRKEEIYTYIKKQKRVEWKPSKEEMDALYSLCYITNTIDDRKDNILTRLYHDLKREFFNGVSYENMFPKEENQKDKNECISANFDEAEDEKRDFVSSRYIQCKKSFDNFKKGAHYWLEYIGDDTYIGRSDDILNQKFHITPKQLFILFGYQL
mgnify:CR=1 FL=1